MKDLSGMRSMETVLMKGREVSLIQGGNFVT